MAHLSRSVSQSGLLQALMRDLGSDMSCAYMAVAGMSGAHVSLRNTNRWFSGSSRAALSSNLSAYTVQPDSHVLSQTLLSH